MLCYNKNSKWEKHQKSIKTITDYTDLVDSATWFSVEQVITLNITDPLQVCVDDKKNTRKSN